MEKGASDRTLSLIVLGTLYKTLQTNAVNPEANYKCVLKQNEGVQSRR